ncbi:uncharacterized protein FYW49_002896 [Xenentodon cancila]
MLQNCGTRDHSDGPHAAYGGTPVNETAGTCLHELERINKEIETVRHEVEQEQRRLSCYQTVQAESNHNAPTSKCRFSGSYESRSSADPKALMRSRKYVVDNSRPRTDLEYDPLSNFSAALRSYSSSGKGQKVKNRQDFKKSKSDHKEPAMQQAHISQSPFPVPLDYQDQACENPQHELSGSDDKLKAIDTLFCKVQDARSPPRQQAKNALTTAQNRVDDKWWLMKSEPSAVQDGKKISSTMPVQMHGKATMTNISVRRQAPAEAAPAEAAPGSSQLPTQHVSSAKPHLNTRAEPNEQLQKTDTETVIIINSSPDDDEEEDLGYLEMDLSDSDPMEECYRIFMEENDDDKEDEDPDKPTGSTMETEKPEMGVTVQAVPGKKRVAHEAKSTEQPLAKVRPQPQVLVPLREQGVSGLGSWPSVTSKIQQVQQRASVLTTSVKAGQAFISSNSQKKLDLQSSSSTPTLTPEILRPPPVPNGYLNYIPVGTAVIEVGNNLHLILPQGAFPLSVAPSTSSPVPPVFSPPVPSKRKLKQQCEAVKEKVPHNVRQRYVNVFTEEFLKTTPNVNDAFQKALAEERTVYNRSANKLKYLSIAVNALKRLKNQSTSVAKNEKEVGSQRLKGNIPLNLKMLKGDDDTAFYESLKDHVLSDERIIENNYPVQHPEKRGCAVLFADKKVNTDPLKRICCRCGATYSVSVTGKHIRKEECNYHYGKGVESRVPGGVETRYSCCQGVMGAPGCQLFKLHVHDSLNMDGFVSTAPRHHTDASCPGVYALNCEMCYTVQGLELSRVTVVNSDLQVIYDTFVRADKEVIDYNTRFSGISEKDVKGTHSSLGEVQEMLLSFISADTILVGHGLEMDLCLLKLLHGMVVDTSVVFPHRLGPPHKLSLNNLTAEYLRRIIQESVCGHDTAEDAAACMELMLWKVKEDGKWKK